MQTAVLLAEEDPHGSKHVGLINTKNLNVLTVLVYIFII